MSGQYRADLKTRMVCTLQDKDTKLKAQLIQQPVFLGAVHWLQRFLIFILVVQD